MSDEKPEPLVLEGELKGDWEVDLYIDNFSLLGEIAIEAEKLGRLRYHQANHDLPEPSYGKVRITVEWL